MLFLVIVGVVSSPHRSTNRRRAETDVLSAKAASLPSIFSNHRFMPPLCLERETAIRLCCPKARVLRTVAYKQFFLALLLYFVLFFIVGRNERLCIGPDGMVWRQT